MTVPEFRTLRCATAVVFLLLGSAMASEYLVAPGGSDANGGSGWNDALASISNALSKADATIVTVSNGSYTVTATLTVTNALTIRSFGGGVYGGLANASNTVVQRTGGTGGSRFRIFRLTHTNAVLDGLSIAGGMGRGVSGLGVNMSGGTVRNCIVRDNGDLSNASAAGLSSGGGIYMTGGVVSNCTIQANKIVENHGAGIYASGKSLIVHSRILENRNDPNYSGSGAGIYANGASVTIRNCLVAGNVGDDSGGGIYGGTVENCTVVGNDTTDASSLGGGVYNSTVVNSIVVDNESGSGGPGVANYAASSLSYSSAAPLPSGSGNVDSAVFVDETAGDFRLLACPAVDAGQNTEWMTNNVDLAGEPRLAGAGGTVDMGAFEKVPGALECGFNAAPRQDAVVGGDVAFTALASGTNLSLTGASWDFGDGQNGSGLVATNVYATPGIYTVSVSVTNSAGETAAATYTDFVTVWGTRVLVATNSPDPKVPYHTWSNASQSVVSALDLAPAGTDVVLSNGSYAVSREMVLDRALTLCGFAAGHYGGLANASNTVIRRPGSNPNHRVFRITNSGVVFDGITVMGGRGRGLAGMGVNMTGGRLLNSIIRDNGDTSTTHAGVAAGVGIWMSGGVVSNCTIQGNISPESDGIGIRAQCASQILGSRILDNLKNAHYSRSGGGIYAASSSVLIRDCLVARNSNWDRGGGVYGGTIVNCTIVSNRINSASGNGGGVFLPGGASVKNSIVYFNEIVGVHSNLNTLVGVESSCIAHPGTTTASNIVDDPLLVNLNAGEYQLSDLSPCINAGDSSIVDWPLDLAGLQRRAASDVDMGAYEWQPPGGSVITVR